MANKDELVKTLRTSVQEFNKWRQGQPPGVIDLAGVDLSNCNLCEAQLDRADLRGANLHGADLTKALLGSADLRDADLTNAKLHGINLHRATLAGAKLDGATLGTIEQDHRICINPRNFQGAHWGKESLEHFLGILNENADWEIRYQLLPKKKK